MEFVWLLTGKTDEKSILDLMEKYEQRLSRFCRFERRELPSPKLRKPQASQMLKAESEQQLIALKSNDLLVLLDEKGQRFNSRQFAAQLEKWQLLGQKRVVFLVGGAYGFHEDIRNRATTTLRLSDMTFSHQIVRVMFAEQFYRAMTILNNHPYHND